MFAWLCLYKLDNFNNIDIFLYVIYYNLWVSLLPYFQSTNCKFAKLWKGVIKGGNQHNWKSANNHFTDSIRTQTTLTGLLKCGLQSTRPYIFIISDFEFFVKGAPSRGMKNALAFWKSNKQIGNDAFRFVCERFRLTWGASRAEPQKLYIKNIAFCWVLCYCYVVGLAHCHFVTHNYRRQLDERRAWAMVDKLIMLLLAFSIAVIALKLQP